MKIHPSHFCCDINMFFASLPKMTFRVAENSVVCQDSAKRRTLYGQRLSQSVKQHCRTHLCVEMTRKKHRNTSPAQRFSSLSNVGQSESCWSASFRRILQDCTKSPSEPNNKAPQNNRQKNTCELNFWRTILLVTNTTIQEKGQVDVSRFNV